MRNILIATVAVAVLVAAGLWYAFEQGMLGTPADEPAPGDRTVASDTSSPGDTTTPGTPPADGKPASTADGDKTPMPAGSTTIANTPSDTSKPSGAGKPSGDGGATTATGPAGDAAAGKAAGTAAGAKAPTEQPAESGLSFDVVRIAREGTAVMAGRGPAGAVVILQRDGEELGRATADALGEWVIVLDQPLPAGPGVLGLVARLPDGSERTAESTLAVDVPARAATPAMTVAGTDKPARQGALAVVVPQDADKVSRILQKPPAATADTPDVTVDKVDYDEAGNVVVAGTAAPGSAVRLYVDNKPVGDTQSGSTGEWTLKPDAPIAAGQHSLRADRLGEGGKVTARIEIPFDRAPRQDILKLAAHRRVIVQPGNSLWRISRRIYGSGMEYTVIYQANSGQIRDPDLIYPGQIFDLPERTTATN